MSGRLPTLCPSCSSELRVVGLACPGCDTSVSGAYTLPPLARLSSNDQEFVMSFVLSSGSLKEMALRYRVSYPTIRNRLDDLIERLADIHETKESDNEDQEIPAQWMPAQ